MDEYYGPMRLRASLVSILIFTAGVASPAADLSAVFSSAGIRLNGVVAEDIVEGRAKLSVAAFTQALGPTSRIRVVPSIFQLWGHRFGRDPGSARLLLSSHFAIRRATVPLVIAMVLSLD